MATADKLATVAENVPKVYAAGAQSEYDMFWNNYQNYGNRTVYANAFSDGYNTNNDVCKWSDMMVDYNFIPKYPLYVSNGDRMFYTWNKKIDLVEFLNTNNIPYDFSNMTDNTMFMFASSYFTRLPVIYSIKQLVSTFLNCTYLETIDGYGTDYVNSGGQQFLSVFLGCSALKNLTILGEIKGNDLNLQWSSYLTHDSLLSIINALADKSADTSGTVWKVIIGGTNMAKLTTEDLDIIEAKGWVFE